MSIEEFVSHYAQQELNRQEQLAFAKDVADTTRGKGDQRHTVIGIQQAKKSMAARRSMMVHSTTTDEEQKSGASDLESMLRDIERKESGGSPSKGYKRIQLGKRGH